MKLSGWDVKCGEGFLVCSFVVWLFGIWNLNMPRMREWKIESQNIK
jgi:hypothetical protein